MKKAISLVLTLCLLMMTAAFGVAETADGSAEALELMENVKGTYEPLFPVITAPEYDQIWNSASANKPSKKQKPERRWLR